MRRKRGIFDSSHDGRGRSVFHHVEPRLSAIIKATDADGHRPRAIVIAGVIFYGFSIIIFSLPKNTSKTMTVPSLENARFSEAVFVTWQDGPSLQRSVRSKIQRYPRRDAPSTKDDDENSIVNGFQDDIHNDFPYRFKRCVYLRPRMVAFQFKTTLTIDDMGVAASGRLRFRETVQFKPKMVEVRQSERFTAGGRMDDDEAIGDRLSWGKPGKKNGHRSFVSKVVRSQTAAIKTHYVTAVHIPSPVVAVAVSVADDLGNGPEQVLVNDVHIYIDHY